MKNRAKATLCLILVLCLSLTSTAYAENETEATTKVTYTKAGENIVTASASYEINIPAELSLNSGRELVISANSMNLLSGQSLYVSLDYPRSNPEGDGYIHLRDYGTGNEVIVSINRYDQTLNGGTLMYSTDPTVAIFTGNSTEASRYGKIYLNLQQASAVLPGTYEGTLYFTIELVNG